MIKIQRTEEPRTRHLACRVLALWFFGSCFLDFSAAADLDPALPYQAERSSPVTYDVDFSVVVTPPYHTHVLKVWLPLPQSDAAQDVSESRLSTFPLEVRPAIARETQFGNQFAYFEFHEPQGAQIVRHQFCVKSWELRWKLDPEKIQAVKEWPASFDRYRRSESQAVQVDERFHDLLRTIVPQSRGGLQDLAAVMRWSTEHLTYDHHDASLRADSVRMLEQQRGHCSDYHGFCAAMGRALGYPTRVAYGINTFPKNSPSHCKLEAFLPPYGWVSFDVSETQKLVHAIRKDAKLSDDEKANLAKAATARLTSGFRDNTWFCLTRGTDYDLAPPASKRVPVVRTAYIEADGVPLPDPDPADPERREFAWMTVHKYTPDRQVPYPFKDFRTLNPEP
ncbi:MAG TPA: transglutaminase domain-containing protein [Pirellulaceae bacterium]|nr:transglutaminase domain-containing protein [Pirellulaceae bacterium]